MTKIESGSKPFHSESGGFPVAGTRPTVRLQQEAKAVTEWVTLYGFSPEPL